MTAGDAAAMTTDDPTPKRPRIEQQQAANGGAGEAPSAAAAPPAATPPLTVPPVGDHVDAEVLLPALQQLLGAYQVEYWSALEQLRAVHSATDAAGQQAVPGGSSEGSLRQLWEASRAAGGSASGADQQGAPRSAPANGQQAAYGDSRCGFASTSSQQQQQQLPSLGEVELLLLQLPRGGRDAGAASAEQQAAWRACFAASAASVAGLEQLASAATLQYMDAQGGLACLCGQQGRWLVRRSAVSIGRSTDTKGEVDIDLSLMPAAAAAAGPAAAGPAAGAEGKAAAPAADNAAAADGSAPPAGGHAAAASPGKTPAAPAAAAAPAAEKAPPAAADAAASLPAAADKAPDTAAPAAPAASAAACKQVSRLQAQLLLTAEGAWSITNTGRAPMAVNGLQLPRGACVPLPHLSLLEVGGMPLLFMVNSLAVQRAVGRSTHLTM